MKFTVSRISEIAIYANIDEPFSGEDDNIIDIIYVKYKTQYFRYQNDIGISYALKDLTVLSEEELFQYSLVYDFEYLNIETMLQLQLKMKEMFDECLNNEVYEIEV